MANQIGLDPLNEAFLHHLLLCGTGRQVFVTAPCVSPNFQAD